MNGGGGGVWQCPVMDWSRVGYGHKEGVDLWTICYSGGNFLPVGRAVDEVLIGLASFLRSRKEGLPTVGRSRRRRVDSIYLCWKKLIWCIYMYSPRIEKSNDLTSGSGADAD